MNFQPGRKNRYRISDTRLSQGSLQFDFVGNGSLTFRSSYPGIYRLRKLAVELRPDSLNEIEPEP